MALSDAKVRAAKPKDKRYKLTDEKSMFLLVAPNGSKYWQLKYRYDGKEKVYQIVGDDEANIKQGKLSVNSPIARGLIGREEGDVVQIDTPGGTREYEVDKVEHI